MLLHSYSNVVSFCWNLVFWPKHFYTINFPIPTIVSTEKFSAAKLLLEVVLLELIKSSVIRFTWIKGGKNKQAYWQRTKYKDSSSSFHSNQALAPLPCHWVYIWTFPSICLQLRDAPLLIKCLWVFYLLLRDGGGDDDAELDGKSRIFKSRRIVEKSRENNLFQELLCFQSIKVDGWQKSTI